MFFKPLFVRFLLLCEVVVVFLFVSSDAERNAARCNPEFYFSKSCS